MNRHRFFPQFATWEARPARARFCRCPLGGPSNTEAISMHLILAAVLAAQTGEEAARPTFTDRALLTADLAMERATEEFAARCDVGRRLPPPAYRALIERTGSPLWRERDQASRDLPAMVQVDPSGRRWLWWGRLSHDLEIRVRANSAIRRLSPCPTCKGTGESSAWRGLACSVCDGAGTAWPRSCSGD